MVAVHLAVYWQHWLGRMTFPHDFAMGYYGASAYWITSVQAGEWPHWLPYQSMGYPFAMNVQTGLFYPPLWVFPALGMPYTLHAATIVQLLHILGGAIGMFLLARAYWGGHWLPGIAAVAFSMFGGFFSNAEHPDIIRAFSLTPWVLWASVVTEGPIRRLQWGRWSFATRLSARHLLLPVIAFFFVTGSYPGNMIAGCFLLAIFLATQGVCLTLDRSQHAPCAGQAHGVCRLKIALTDTFILAGLFALGLALAAPHLAPPAMLGTEYVRTEEFGAMGRWYATLDQLMYLVFPNSVSFNGAPPSGDWSMVGMQLPVVLLPFLLLVRRQDVGRLLPLLVIGLVAAVMALDVFVPISRLVWGACPPLGYSRMVLGDYRLFFCLAVLLLCMAGVRRALCGQDVGEPASGGGDARAVVTRIAAASFLLLGIAMSLLLAGRVPGDQRQRFLWLFGWEAAGLAALMVLLTASRRPKFSSLFAPALALLCVTVVWPVPMELRRYWRTREAEWNLYDAHGVSLKQGDRLSVEALFQRPVDGPRPARIPVPDVFHASWRGYINGAYMMSDCGSNVSRARRAVENNFELEQLMLRSSTLLAVESSDRPQTIEMPRSSFTAARPGPLTEWRVVEYGRNHVSYHLRLARPAIVVENELDFPGWIGRLDGGEEVRPIRIAGALRGWKLPAGEHDFYLQYRTPGLVLGLQIAAAAMAAYAVILLAAWRGSIARPADRCDSPTSTHARGCYASAA